MKTQKVTWKVQITDEAAKVFGSAKLSEDDRRIIQKWAELVRDQGPDALLKRPDIWNDHALDRGQWVGFRASNFSHSGRIIYRIDAKVITIIVVRITPDHDYK